MRQNILKYGIIAGGIMLVVFTLSWLILGMEPENYTISEIIGYTAMILSLLTIYFGIKNFKENISGGKITYGKALLVGLQITLIASLIFGVFTYVVVELLYPNFTEEYYQHYTDQIKNSGLPQEEIDKQLEELNSMADLMHSSFFQGFLMFITVFAIGLIISLVSSFILKSKPAAA